MPPILPTRQALSIIKGVLTEQPNPLKIQDLYKLALQKPCIPAGEVVALRTSRGSTPPPNDHAVRSMSYLKRVLLPELVRRGEAEQIHSKVMLSPEEVQQRLQSMTKAQRKSASQKSEHAAFVWRLKSPQVPSRPKPKPKLQPERKWTVSTKDVGARTDWSHLNLRRQRARRTSVIRDVAWVKELSEARSSGSANTR